MQNNGYCHLDVPVIFTTAGGTTMFTNADTLILDKNCIFTNTDFINQVFNNLAGAYLYSDVAFKVKGMGYSFLDYKGKAILGPNSSFTGEALSSTVPVISNTDTLFMQGPVKMTKLYAYGLYNSGYTAHSSTFRISNCNRGLMNDGGTMVNTGSMQFDSIATDGMAFQGAQSFTNTADGTISIRYCIQNGINNMAGNFTNEGAITIGALDSIGQSGIANSGIFTNKNQLPFLR